VTIRSALLALLIAAPVSQPLSSQSATTSATTAKPSVRFTLDFPQSNPAHYFIAVDATGHASFECTGKVVEDSEEENYRTEFEVSPQGRQHIFDWAKEAHYFSGKIDSGNGKLAFTGAKILEYHDGARSNTARYNYSNLEAVQKLTALFQSTAATLEFGQRLAYYHRYQKLALDEEIKRMEEQARENQLSELQGVAPVLRAILDDPSVINVVRARARELIQMGGGDGTP
jgi:hypothetical protein